jgi:hypothetical protein
MDKARQRQGPGVLLVATCWLGRAKKWNWSSVTKKRKTGLDFIGDKKVEIAG